MSGFCAVPRVTGCSGLSARRRNSASASRSSIAVRAASSISSIFWISCEVRKPSKKCRNGTRDLSVTMCATPARSITSCTDEVASMANPVWRVAMTSWWSPKIDSDCAASARAETWNTPGSNSPEILYILGIISSKPCDAVNVDVRAPLCNEPCTAPAAPASDCISTTFTVSPKIFLRPCAAHSSTSSAMVDDGVMG